VVRVPVEEDPIMIRDDDDDESSSGTKGFSLLLPTFLVQRTFATDKDEGCDTVLLALDLARTMDLIYYILCSSSSTLHIGERKKTQQIPEIESHMKDNGAKK
jgi:hypothetical protein